MKKLVGFVFISLFFIFSSPAEASLVTITEDNRVIINVLSSEDAVELGIPEREYLEVKEVVEDAKSENPSVTLANDGDRVSLTVSSDEDVTKHLDVTDYEDDVVEIEEREKVKTIQLGVFGDKLSVRQRGIIATTNLPLNVDPDNKELSVTTSSGRQFLAVLPKEAVDSIMRTKLVTRVNYRDGVEIVEEDGGDASYLIKGLKVISIFDLYDYEVGVTARVSAKTGEVVGIDNPDWLKALNFLFV